MELLNAESCWTCSKLDRHIIYRLAICLFLKRIWDEQVEWNMADILEGSEVFNRVHKRPSRRRQRCKSM